MMSRWRRPAPADAIVLDDPPVEVRLRRLAHARRFTLRLATAGGGLTLTVPPGTSEREILRFLHAQRGWIRARLARLPHPVIPAPGTQLRVGDRTLLLETVSGRRVLERDGTLLVPGEDELFRSRLRNWLKAHARDVAHDRLAAHAGALGRPYGTLTLRDPRSRWGSCTSRGDIMLSWRLILAPAEVLDYVAAHEVAHLVEMNHSPAFWKVMARLMPDYQRPRTWLRTNGATLHRIGL